MPSSNTQTFSLFFSTGFGGNDDSIQQVPIIGATPGSFDQPVFQGGANPPSIRAIALDPANGVYFVTADAGSNNGTLGTYIYEEHFGQTPTFGTSSALLVTDQGPGEITALGDDTADQTLFYIDGAQGNTIYRLGYGADATSQIQVATLPAIGPNPPHGTLYYGPMAYDQQDHVGYFGAQSGSVTITSTPNGFTTKTSLTGNYIYKVTGLTKDANSAGTHSSAITVPVADGIIQSLSYDSGNDTLYFVTQSFGASTPHFGLYSFNPSNNAITPIWQLPENSTSTLQHSEVLTVDPDTGDYFISTESGGIFEGNIHSSAVPTTAIRANNVGDGQAVPFALAIDDGATVSSVAVAAIDGNTGHTTGQIQPGDSITIDVTFSETVEVQGTTSLGLDTGGTASYVSGSGSDELVYRYQPSAGQNATTLTVTGLNGTVTDLAGTDVSGASVTATFSGVSVDGTPPALGVTYTSTEAVQGGPAIAVLSATPTITDAHGDGTLTSAKVVLTNYQTGDVLGVNGNSGGSLDGGAITYSYADGTLSFTGSDTLAQYEAALAGVTYQDTGTDTSTSGHQARTVDMSVTEGSLTSTLVQFQLTIDRPPAIASNGYSAEVVESQLVTGGTGAALAGDSDPDGDTLAVTQITSSQGVASPGDALAGTYGELTLNADGSYSYTADNTTAIDGAANGPLTDIFTFTVSDGNGGSSTETFTVDVDRPPELSGSSTVTYTQSVGAVGIDPSLTVADPDGELISGGTVQIGSGFLAGDLLAFSTQNGITGDYDSSDGLLTLTGDASAADYEAALQSIQFSNTSADPADHGNDTSRTLGIGLTELSPSGTSVPSNAFTTLVDVAPGVVCYAAGTRILTPDGEVPVETLKIGDCVVTDSGAHRPIQWLGHRTLRLENHPKPLESRPVRIAAHAIADAMPHTDLVVSPWHAIYVEGVLIPARYLLNDATITQLDIPSITYWHIELESHDVILANGLPAESYLERGNRKFFVEPAQVSLIAVPDGPQTDADFCRPIIRKGEILDRIRKHLAARAEACPPPRQRSVLR